MYHLQLLTIYEGNVNANERALNMLSHLVPWWLWCLYIYLGKISISCKIKKGERNEVFHCTNKILK